MLGFSVSVAAKYKGFWVEASWPLLPLPVPYKVCLTFWIPPRCVFEGNFLSWSWVQNLGLAFGSCEQPSERWS